MCSIAWWHFQWRWRTPDPVFKVTTFLKSNIVKWHILKTKLLLHKMKLYLTYNGAMFGDLDWPLNVSHGLVSISWGSCYFSSYYYYKNTDYNDTQVTRGLANLPKVTRNIWWSKIRLEDPRGEQICGTFFPSMLWHYWVTGRESANKRLSVGLLVVTVWGVLHVVFL